MASKKKNKLICRLYKHYQYFGIPHISLPNRILSPIAETILYYEFVFVTLFIINSLLQHTDVSLSNQLNFLFFEIYIKCIKLLLFGNLLISLKIMFLIFIHVVMYCYNSFISFTDFVVTNN